MKLNQMFKKDPSVVNAKQNYQFKENTISLEQFILSMYTQKNENKLPSLQYTQDSLNTYNQTV